MTDQAIAAEIRAALARKQISQAKVAESLDLTPSALSRRLHGKIPFSAVEVGRVAHTLNVSVASLYGEVTA